MRWGKYMAAVLAVAVTACDPPPSSYAFYLDGGTTATDGAGSDDTRGGGGPTDEGTDEGTDSAADSETATTTCLEAVLCIAANPADLFGCTAGMDDASRAATTAAAVCLLKSCKDTLADTVALALCAASNCSQESIDCVAGQFLGGQVP